MPNKLPAVVSGIATLILLVIIGFFFFFVQIVALNGVIDESQAFASLGMGVVCQGVSILLAAAFAGWFANRLIVRFDWSKVVAVVVAVVLGTLLGAAVAFISTVLAIPLAGIR